MTALHRVNSAGDPLMPVPRGRPRVIGHVLHRLDVAGAEMLAAGLARKLALGDEAAYRFVFMCLDGVGEIGGELAAEGFTVIELARQPGLDFGVALRLRRAVREHGIELLHAHQYTPFFYAAAARGAAANPPIIFTEHGRHYPDARRSRRVLANRVLLRRLDRVTAVGEFVRDALIANEGIAPQRIGVIYNGIDPSRFGANEAQRIAARAALRAELNLPDRALVALQVARFHRVKDHATSVRAFAAVVAEVRDAVLVLAGDGSQRGEIEHLVRELGLEAHVKFLGVRHDVPMLMRAADVFVLSSLSEGVSLTLLEAMATPLPIVATDVGGNREVVGHGLTGLLSPRSDAGAMAKHLVQLLRDPALCCRFAAAGRERLEAQFTEARMHASYDALYRDMLTPAILHARAG